MTPLIASAARRKAQTTATGLDHQPTDRMEILR
jgi:hypothetical protein